MRKTIVFLLIFLLLASSVGNVHTESRQEHKSNVTVRLDFRITIPTFVRLSYELGDQIKLQVAAVTGRATPVILHTGASEVLRFADGGYYLFSIDPPAVAFCYDSEGGGDQTVIYTLSSP